MHADDWEYAVRLQPERHNKIAVLQALQIDRRDASPSLPTVSSSPLFWTSYYSRESEDSNIRHPDFKIETAAVCSSDSGCFDLLTLNIWKIFIQKGIDLSIVVQNYSFCSKKCDAIFGAVCSRVIIFCPLEHGPQHSDPGPVNTGFYSQILFQPTENNSFFPHSQRNF